MAQIRFDLGKNIHETAKQSGAPSFATRNVAGLISYKLLNLPSAIPVVFQRKGYEFTALPLFGFTLYADKLSNDNLGVDAASLQFSTNEIKSHESARAFVERLNAQFKKGKWKRFIDELCPAVTGRSSFLNEAGEPEQVMGCALDPQYHLSMEDWIPLMRMTQYYEWMGDGILAKLSVRFSDDIRGLTYDIWLEFEDFSIKKRREEELAVYRSTDNANAMSNAAQRGKDIVEARLRIKVLEENAIRRGDGLAAR